MSEVNNAADAAFKAKTCKSDSESAEKVMIVICVG